MVHFGIPLLGSHPGTYSTIMKSIQVIVDAIIIVHEVYNNLKHTLDSSSDGQSAW